MFQWLKYIFTGNRPFQAPNTQLVTEFHNSVVGVSYRNRDRTSRQKIIKEDIQRGQELVLFLEDDNPKDRFAVAAMSSKGRQVGYLDERLAREVRDWLAAGRIVRITVDDVTGGYGAKPTYGVNIHVRVWEAV